MQNNAPKSAPLPREVLTSHHFINRISRFLNKAASAAHHFLLNLEDGRCCAWTSLLFFSHQYTDAKRGQLFDRNYCARDLGRYPSGQRGQTVNLLPSASKVRILACPPKRAVADGSAKCLSRAPLRRSRSHRDKGGRSSAVESQPSKLAVVGSTPTARSKWYGPTLFVTQLEAGTKEKDKRDRQARHSDA